MQPATRPPCPVLVYAYNPVVVLVWFSKNKECSALSKIREGEVDPRLP